MSGSHKMLDSKELPTFDADSAPYIPPEYFHLVHPNFKLMSNYQLQALQVKINGSTEGYYPPQHFNMQYGILKTKNDLFAQIIEPIGEGGEGKVYDCQSLKTGEWYVVKEMNSKRGRRIEHEHENLIFMGKSIKEYQVTSQTHTYVIMQKEKGLELYQCFKQKKVNGWSLLKRVYFALLLFDTINKDFHQKDLIHRDIKLENIIISLLQVVLVDYASVHFENKQSIPFSSTQDYWAPETKKRGIYNKKTDVFAAGIVFGELLAQKNCGYDKKNKRFSYPTLPTSLPEDLKQLVRSMVDLDSSKRPTIQQAYDQLFKFYMQDQYKNEREEIEKEKKSFIHDIKKQQDEFKKQLLQQQQTEEYLTEILLCGNKSQSTQKMIRALSAPAILAPASCQPAKNYTDQNPKKTFARSLSSFFHEDLDVQQRVAQTPKDKHRQLRK